jgi:hypothetical protein
MYKKFKQKVIEKDWQKKLRRYNKDKRGRGNAWRGREWEWEREKIRNLDPV